MQVQAAIEKTRPMFEEMEGMGDLALVKTETAPSAEQLKNMSVDEIKGKLQQIKPERYREVTPQTGLTPDEYANIVQQQADELGVNISKGNPEKVNNGVMHFVLKYGNDKNYIKLLNNTTLKKPEIDNLFTKNNEFYSKYQIKPSQLVDKIKRSEIDNLSINQNILNDMGISPSLEYTNNISPIARIVKENDVIADTIGKVKRSLS